MDIPFTLTVSRDRMKAWVHIEQDVIIRESPEEVEKWLNDQGITAGIMKGELVRLCHGDISLKPFLVARGKQPINGKDGRVIFHVSPQLERREEGADFRDVIHIPSVQTGDRIATIKDPENGVCGTDIYGNRLLPRRGKPAAITLGLNVIQHGNEIMAVSDGEVSFNWNVIQVNPVYVVDGDLDLSVGNIEFIGNVTIKGNVPPGYKIRVGGDLKVFGLIEGSDIQADGSIYVQGGISGEQDCQIRAGATLKSLYINRANVLAFGDIEVKHYILHSQVTSYGLIRCRRGQLIGGAIQAVKGVEIRGAGNIHYAHTLILIGQTEAIERHKSELDMRAKQLFETISKLTMIAAKFEVMRQETGTVGVRETILLKKQRRTREVLEQELSGIREERLRLEYGVNEMDAEIIVHGICYPNVHIQIGKYTKPLNQIFKSVRFTESGREISVHPL